MQRFRIDLLDTCTGTQKTINVSLYIDDPEWGAGVSPAVGDADGEGEPPPPHHQLCRQHPHLLHQGEARTVGENKSAFIDISMNIC